MNKFKKHKLATAIGIICFATNFSAFAAETNLVTNGDFESPLLQVDPDWIPTRDDSGWLATKDHIITTIVSDATLSSDVVHLTDREKGADTLKQIVKLEVGKTYKLSGKAKSAGSVAFAFSVHGYDIDGSDTHNSYPNSVPTNSDGDWVDISYEFTVPSVFEKKGIDYITHLTGDHKIWVLSDIGNDTTDYAKKVAADLYFDDIVLVEVVAVVDTDGDTVSDDDDAFPNDAAAALDTDGDGFPDDWNDGQSQADSTSDPQLEKDAFPNDAAAYLDTDGDGMPDSWNDGKSQADSTSDPVLELDVFPNDSTNGQSDSDGDGISDIDDVFPDDVNEWADTDGDGVGDNADAFPEDATETLDSDDDGVGDNADVFPDDATESIDTDGDGVGDNGDAFPEDATETLDSDGDGVGDNADLFPDDAEETLDTDLDGVGDNSDAFPEDSTESLDTDGDGVGDNADPFPEDPYDGVVQAGSKLSKPDSYENRADKDYWTAYDILGERLDIMRYHVSASLNLTADDEIGSADYPDVDAWLVDNPQWQWSTPEQYIAIHGFFDSIKIQENIDAFLELTGDQWSTWARPGKPSKWLMLTKDTRVADQTDLPIMKYTVTELAFTEDIATATGFKLKSVNAAAVLVRTINFDPYADDDGDGVDNVDDLYPNDPEEWQDSDGDGVGDNADAFPNDPDEIGDADGDGIGDNADLDADNDGVPNSEDGFPTDSEQSISVAIGRLVSSSEEVGTDIVEGDDVTFIVLTLNADGTSAGLSQLPQSWQQLSGPSLNITEIESGIYIDVLPSIQVDEKVVLEVTITNGIHTTTVLKTFMLRATPSFVTVQANIIGGEQIEDASGAIKTMLTPGATIELDGSGSSDTLDAVLTYQWVQTRGPVIELINANQATASFVVPSYSSDASKVGFRLTVSNGQSHEDATVVSVVSAEIEGDSDSGGSFGLWSMLLAGIALFKKSTTKITNTRVRGA